MSATPIPGSIRAARRIMDTLGEFPDQHRVGILAELIEQETGADKLLGALREITNRCESILKHAYPDSSVEVVTSTFHNFVEIACTAIAKAERT